MSTSYEKKLAAQAKAKQKQLEKIKSPEYQQKQKEKARRSTEKAIQKAKDKASCPIYRKEMFEKARQKQQQKAKSSTRSTSKPRRSTTSKERSRNRVDIELHNQLGQLGCICCILHGLVLPFGGQPVSIHHCDGRTKFGCHQKVLPLCQWHHDTPLPAEKRNDDTYTDVFPIHAKGKEGGKAKWVALHGTQEELIIKVFAMINYTQSNEPRTV